MGVKISRTEVGPIGSILEPIYISGIPKPVIRGPLLVNDLETILSKTTENNEHKVGIVQGILSQYGYYEHEIDGVFGNITEWAVENYQRATGVLKVDGVVGPFTKAFMLRKRYGNKDIGDDVMRNIYMLRGNEIYLTFFMANIPPSLTWQNKEDLQTEIAWAFRVWSDAINNENDTFIRFVWSDKAETADILIKWTDQSEQNIFKFDGIEGDVGEIKIIGNKQVLIDLDMNQEWTLKLIDDTIDSYFQFPDEDYNQLIKDKKVSLLPAMLHLIGNAIGLTHSDQSEDVMSPFYNDSKVQLSENDVGRVKRMFQSKRSWTVV